MWELFTFLWLLPTAQDPHNLWPSTPPHLTPWAHLCSDSTYLWAFAQELPIPFYSSFHEDLPTTSTCTGNPPRWALWRSHCAPTWHLTIKACPKQYAKTNCLSSWRTKRDVACSRESFVTRKPSLAKTRLLPHHYSLCQLHLPELQFPLLWNGNNPNQKGCSVALTSCHR